VDVPVLSGTVANVSFGVAVFGLVYGYKFYDKDLDGQMDALEPGLSGWTIVLDGYTTQGVHVHNETTTGPDGYYAFGSVQPGRYSITEILWPDWAPTTILPVPVSMEGAMSYFEVKADIGNVRYATVNGWKFLDLYTQTYPYWPNGAMDDNEDGIGNWEITLQGMTDSGVPVDKATYTNNTGSLDDIGYFEFGELLPGAYWLNETMMEHFYATRAESYHFHIYPFPYGKVVERYDFGNMIPEPDPEINFVLKKGVNLWSSPLEIPGGMMASGLAAAIGPTAVKITMYNTTTKTYNSFLPAYNKAGSEYDFPILFGVGYYVAMSADAAFTLEGNLVSNAVVQLAGGVNILGYTELVPILASDLASHITGAKVYKITYYDPVAKVYKSFLPGINKVGSQYDFTVTQGRAYFVATSGPANLALAA